MGSTPFGGCIGCFLKFLFSKFRSNIKDSKWGRKCTFIKFTSCNGSPQQIPFQIANGKLPHSGCRAFWARFVSSLVLFAVCACGQLSVQAKKSIFGKRDKMLFILFPSLRAVFNNLCIDIENFWVLADSIEIRVPIFIIIQVVIYFRSPD